MEVRRFFPVSGIISVIILLLASVAAPQASLASESDQPGLVAPGTWGGRGASMRVGDEMTEIEFDCALGRIESPFAVQAGGEFSLSGFYFIEPGGPGLAGESGPRGVAAEYFGQVWGSELQLTVRIIETGRSIGPFDLYQSKQPEMEKCL
jgi:hypothetical protein